MKARTRTTSSLLVGECLVGLITTNCSRTIEDHTTSTTAAELETTRCSVDIDESALQPIIDGTLVESVEPLHPNWSKFEPGISGAIIKVRATLGITPEWLSRALECYSAKSALGHVTTRSNDPFFLPGRAVHIEVRSSGDAFLVGVHGNSPADARAILERANALVTHSH